MLDPGIDCHTPSSVVGRWNRTFRSIGYPELDLIEYADGEKAIIQYMHTPIIPSLTKWSFVLQGLRNVEITKSWCKYWAEKLDINKRGVWDELERGEKENLRQQLEEDRRSEDFAERMLKGVKNNPDLMERVVKNGLQELNPRRMLNHISRSRLGKHGKNLRER
jgi:hypothetical protein